VIELWGHPSSISVANLDGSNVILVALDAEQPLLMLDLPNLSPTEFDVDNTGVWLLPLDGLGYPNFVYGVSLRRTLNYWELIDQSLFRRGGHLSDDPIVDIDVGLSTLDVPYVVAVSSQGQLVQRGDVRQLAITDAYSVVASDSSAGRGSLAVATATGLWHSQLIWNAAYNFGFNYVLFVALGPIRDVAIDVDDSVTPNYLAILESDDTIVRLTHTSGGADGWGDYIISEVLGPAFGATRLLRTDFDSDGIDDLLLIGAEGTIRMYRGADGWGQPLAGSLDGFPGQRPLVFDIDGDGRREILTVGETESAGRLHVFRPQF
jgi:hypothetical protein